MAVLDGRAGAEPDASNVAADRERSLRSGRIAWAIIGTSIPFLAVGVWLQLVRAADPVAVAYGAGAAAAASAALLSITTPVSGAVIVTGLPRHRLGWLLVSAAPVGGLFALAFGLARVRALGEATPALAAVLDATFQPVMFSIAALAMLWFPDGRLASRSWWPAHAVLAAGAIIRALEGLLSPDGSMLPGLRAGAGATGPVADAVALSVSLGGVGFRLLQTALLLGAASLVVRYLRADADRRLQLRWVIAAGLVAFVCTLPIGIVTVVEGTGAQAEWAVVVLNLGLALVGPAILVAITRYRLYEIDRIVNRAVLYGVLTALVAGIAAALTTLIQRAFMVVTGDRSDVAIVVAALVAATCYAPLKRRVEAVVDRRFRWDGPRFGAYRAALMDHLALATAGGASARLSEEAVRGLGVTGAAVLDRDGRVLGASGVFPASPIARLQVAETGPMRVLALGPRVDGRALDPAALEDLREIAALAARAAGGG